MRLVADGVSGVLGADERMIHWAWTILAFVVGGMIGFFAAALFAANGDGRNGHP